MIHVPGPGEDLVVVKSKMPELPEYGAIIKVCNMLYTET